MEIIEKLDQVNYLYDIYGELLSDRQREVVEMYYLNDYSLGEIALYYRISRQAVHDVLKRAVEYLQYLEEKLGLQREYRSRKHKLEEARQLADQLTEREGIPGPEINRLQQLLYELDRENEGENWEV